MNFQLAKKLAFKLEYVIHVGAHKFEESSDYNAYGTKQVVWIDPLPQIDPKTLPNNQKFIRIAVDNVSTPSQRDFKVFSATGFSSFYDLIQQESLLRGTPPREKVIKVTTDSLTNIIALNNLSNFNSLVIDTQGSEFEILLSVNLDQFDEIIVETSRKQLYENEKAHDAVNQLLIEAGFHHNMNDSDFFFGHGDQYYSKSISIKFRFQSLVRTIRTLQFIRSLYSRLGTGIRIRITKLRQQNNTKPQN